MSPHPNPIPDHHQSLQRYTLHPRASKPPHMRQPTPPVPTKVHTLPSATTALIPSRPIASFVEPIPSTFPADVHTARLRPRSAGAQPQLACGKSIFVQVISVKFRPQQMKPGTATTEYAAATIATPNHRAHHPAPFIYARRANKMPPPASTGPYTATSYSLLRRFYAPTEPAPTTYRDKQRRTQTSQHHPLPPSFFLVYRLHLRSAAAGATSTHL